MEQTSLLIIDFSFSAIVQGALIGLLIYTVSHWYENIYGRIKTNLESLEQNVILLNENLNTINLNLSFMSKIKESLDAGKLPFIKFMNLIEIDRRLLIGLINIELKNDLFSLTIEFVKHNSIVEAYAGSNPELRRAIESGKVSPTTIKSALSSLSADLDAFKGLLESLKSKSLEGLAKTRTQRVISANKNVLSRMASKGERYTDEFKKKWPDELKLLQNEMESITQKNLEEIKKRMGTK